MQNHGLEILIVEDSPTQAERLSYFLNQNGYVVFMASNGKEALALLCQKKSKNWLVLSDIVMPEMDGYELCRAIRADEVLKEIPLILLTQLQDPADVIHGLECGANNFLVKPIEEKFLLYKIQQVMANQELRKNAQSEMGINVFFGGKNHFVTSDRLQILDLLLSTYEHSYQQKLELARIRDELKNVNENLEEIVKQRTAELRTEIEERQRVETSLRDSEQRYRGLFETMLAGFALHEIILDPSGKPCDYRFLEVNPSFERITGLKREEVIGRRALEVLPQLEPEWIERFGKVALTGETVRFENPVGELGKHFEVLAYGPAEGQFATTFTDITDRMRAMESERRSRDLAEAMSSAMLTFLQTGNINQMVQVLLKGCISITGAGLGMLFDLDGSDEARILAITAVVDNDEKVDNFIKRVTAKIEERGFAPVPRCAGLMFSSSSVEKTVLENTQQDGKTSSVEMPEGHPTIDNFLSAPLRVGDETLGILALANRPGGFTQREQEEVEAFARTAALALQSARAEQARLKAIEQLRVSQKFEAIGQLAGGVAHDFNNLLSVINGYSDLMIRKMSDDDPFKNDARLIKEAGQRAAGLTRQLLAFSRRQVLEPQIIDINKLVMGLEKILHRLIREDIELVWKLKEDVGCIKADPGQIEQILINFVVNARDAIEGVGMITVETLNKEFDEPAAQRHPGLTPGRYVMVSVADTGSGMNEETKNRIFEPFFTTKEPGRGTGLGLATVYGILKQSGGYILVDSMPDQGSTFQIFLPRTDEPVTIQATEVSPELAKGQKTILVVEDEPEVLNIVARMLEEYDFKVVKAKTPEEAWKVFQSEQVDLLLTDMVMPGMSGPQLAARLKERAPALKVLFMSGYGEFHGDNRPKNNGEQFFIQKPFSPESLVALVNRILVPQGTREGNRQGTQFER